MGDFGANVAEVRGSACGFPTAGHKKKYKAAEGRVMVEGDEKKVLQGAGTHPLRTYMYWRQAKVAEWVALRPIFDVCARETGYEEGWRLRVTWWRQAEAEKKLKVTVEEILSAARVRS